MSRRTGPGFTVLYRWRIDPTKEQQWIEAWSTISELLLRERGSLGSRLHKGADGLWYSYAQWPSAEARDRAFQRPSLDPEATARMQDAILERYPELVLESVSDFLVVER